MGSKRSFISYASILYSELYRGILEPEFNRLQDCVADISMRNIALGSVSHSMILDGILITPPARVTGIQAKPIHPSLKEELRAIYNALESFKRERAFIKNASSLVVPEQCQDYSQLRDAVSDMIASYCPNLRNVERTRPHMYHILDNEISIKTWTRAESYLEYYIGNILVFS